MTINEFVNIESDPDNKSLFLRIENTPQRIDTAGRRGLALAGKIVVKTAKDGIKNPPKTGRYYIKNGRRHRASREGEYPANQTGELRNSIGYTIEGTRKVSVGARAKYAGFLEDGTKGMGQRPFLKNSVKQNEKEIYATIEKEVAQGMNE